MAYPRSIQISRWIQLIDASISVICGEDIHSRTDETIAPGIEKQLQFIIREPFHRPAILHYMDAISDRWDITWSHVPDVCKGWVYKISRRFIEWQKYSEYTADLLITFGQPMSDHLFGLKYTKEKKIPWIAHFSDPWTDNPFKKYNPLTLLLNKRLERCVIEHADALIFTSQDALELVMKKYPVIWKQKAFYVPHCYNRDLFNSNVFPTGDKYTLRYIGNFYGYRSPRPLFDALEVIAGDKPNLFKSVSIEFIGTVENRQKNNMQNFARAHNFVSFKEPVTYTKSLNLMQTSNCLLIIDAPAEKSIFFPSKLVDYIGSGRFIFAITPKGQTADVVRELGGIVADPADVGAVADALIHILEQKPMRLTGQTDRFEKDTVGREIKNIVEHVLEKNIRV